MKGERKQKKGGGGSLVFLLVVRDAQVQLVAAALQALGFGFAFGDRQGEDLASLRELEVPYRLQMGVDFGGEDAVAEVAGEVSERGVLDNGVSVGAYFVPPRTMTQS